ncbi:MAG: autotransporter outer membrane beta-barrel domain-containing protein [Gemmatimonadetes bacterium]|nr:autotransporter outer membrane beta-barrel domain-containing protein [Gemmatimonadota bacterium]
MRIHPFAAVVVLAVLPAAAGAQAARQATSPPPKPTAAIPADAPMYARQGTWFGVGLGAGSTSLHCQICDSEDAGTRGTSGYIRVGTTVNGRFLVGAELNGWMRSAEAGSQRVLALTGDGYWYPNPRHGYYFKGGFGYSRYKQWSTDDNNNEIKTGIATGGLTGQVGAGYEVRVNPRMSFVPFVNLIGTARGALFTERSDDTSFERNRLPNRANVLFLQLGMGLTWH